MFDKIGFKLTQIFTSSKQKIDDSVLSKIEEKLVLSDISVDIVDALLYKLKQSKFNKDVLINDLNIFIKNEIAYQIPEQINSNLIDKIKNGPKPYTIVFSGINGAGKTTTLAKLANQLKNLNLKVLVCAADTFRAVASEQLNFWANKINVDIIFNNSMSPASLVFDGYKKAINEHFDVLLVDTSGRLQTRNDLMEELNKINRVLKKQDETSPHDSILVLDATMGQNMLSQTEIFLQYANITGFILTKLDGTSKGGAVISLLKKYKLPIYMFGTGEDICDLEQFNLDKYLNNLFGAI